MLGARGGGRAGVNIADATGMVEVKEDGEAEKNGEEKGENKLEKNKGGGVAKAREKYGVCVPSHTLRMRLTGRYHRPLRL